MNRGPPATSLMLMSDELMPANDRPQNPRGDCFTGP